MLGYAVSGNGTEWRLLGRGTGAEDTGYHPVPGGNGTVRPGDVIAGRCLMVCVPFEKVEFLATAIVSEIILCFFPFVQI